jgi:hypothetical protein
MSFSNNHRTNGRDRLNQTKQATLNVFEVISEQFVNTLIELHFDSDDKPLWIHFE